MADIFDKTTRSRVMSLIRSKNTKIECILGSAMRKKGLRYKAHYNIVGTPDMAFPNRRTAVFVDGDFWHGYRFKALKPKLKNKYWIDKIVRNMKRDKEVNRTLKEQGWKIVRLWGHEVLKDPLVCVAKIKLKMGAS